MWEAIKGIVIAAMDKDLMGLVVIVVLAWMVDRFMLVRDLRKVNTLTIDALTSNTRAITELSTLINQLCSRV
jgi:hypothetical protein